MVNKAFNPDSQEWLNQVFRLHGNITQLAKKYDVSRETVYQYLNRNPDNKELLYNIRSFNTEFDLDIAEHVNRFNMLNFEKNPGLAQRAAEKVIDKKGHLRGWKETTNDSTPPLDDKVDRENQDMEEKALLRKQLAEIQAKLDHITKTRPELLGSDPSF
ncbi:MAG TPA: helix-turn-helix domain-containing protein [Hanamia sp.]|nr:helix-turn-helix domain-containing protein [Hanamia sp.]